MTPHQFTWNTLQPLSNRPFCRTTSNACLALKSFNLQHPTAIFCSTCPKTSRIPPINLIQIHHNFQTTKCDMLIGQPLLQPKSDTKRFIFRIESIFQVPKKEKHTKCLVKGFVEHRNMFYQSDTSQPANQHSSTFLLTCFSFAFFSSRSFSSEIN